MDEWMDGWTSVCMYQVRYILIDRWTVDSQTEESRYRQNIRERKRQIEYISKHFAQIHLYICIYIQKDTITCALCILFALETDHRYRHRQIHRQIDYTYRDRYIDRFIDRFIDIDRCILILSQVLLIVTDMQFIYTSNEASPTAKQDQQLE